jgi:Uma2 family endonuclease
MEAYLTTEISPDAASVLAVEHDDVLTLAPNGEKNGPHNGTKNGVTMRYADYRSLDLDDNFFYELIQGELVKKAAPSPLHQRIVRKILLAFENFRVAQNLGGEVFTSPIDVFIDDENAPQPDVLFIREENKQIITSDGIFGVPDIVVEVLSPSSVVRDRITKMALYGQFGVSEYWIIDLNNVIIEIYTNTDKGLQLDNYAVETGTVQSRVLQGLVLDVAVIFTT